MHLVENANITTNSITLYGKTFYHIIFNLSLGFMILSLRISHWGREINNNIRYFIGHVRLSLSTFEPITTRIFLPANQSHAVPLGRCIRDKASHREHPPLEDIPSVRHLHHYSNTKHLRRIWMNINCSSALKHYKPVSFLICSSSFLHASCF